MSIIKVEDLELAYGKTVVLKDVSFEINEGEIFGIIGQNGAGKTTMSESIVGLRNYSVGTVSLDGLDPKKDKKGISEKVSIQLQDSIFPSRARVWEICELYASFYEDSQDYSQLLVDFGLDKRKNHFFAHLSGGEKQRLSILVALFNKPKILFLDELTTGLDPVIRRSMWDYLLSLRDSGITIVLTTHFMAEAMYLCDRVALFHQGKLINVDKPNNIIKELPFEERVSFILREKLNLFNISHDDIFDIKYNGREIELYGNKGIKTIVEEYLDRKGFDYSRLRSSTPSLEDAFIYYTTLPVEGEFPTMKHTVSMRRSFGAKDGEI
jgi:ABC-2 type transport system ATP-binding protein